MEKRENGTEEYLKERGINDKVRIQQVWLGVLAGLMEEDIDLYCLDDYVPKQRDYIRIALEEGMPREEVKRELCRMELDPEEIMKKKREYFLKLESGPVFGLVSRIEKQLEENNQMAAFLKSVMEGQNTMTGGEREVDYGTREKLEKEIVRLSEQIEEMKSGGRMPAQQEKTKEDAGIFGRVADYFLEKEKKRRDKKNGEGNTEQKEDIFDILSNPEFEPEQMQEILEGYKSGMSLEQIKRYAKPQYTAEKMRELKECLLLLTSTKK